MLVGFLELDSGGPRLEGQPITAQLAAVFEAFWTRLVR